MSRRVLLVDTDVDALGHLASALRARGILVANAGDAFEAVEQAFQARPDVVMVDARLDDEQDLVKAFDVVPELAEVPVLRLVQGRAAATLGPSEVLRSDLDHVVSRIAEASPRTSHIPLEQELRGNIEQMPMVDLLQLLNMNRRSGALAITTAQGSGEVRLSEGEVVDAAYRRIQGEKAFYRLLGEREGRFAFSPGTANPPAEKRRISAPTSQLLMEAMRQVDEVQRRRGELALSAEGLRFVDGPLPAGASPERAELIRDLGRLLSLPRTLDDLLDEHPATDLAILEALVTLDGERRLGRVPMAALTTPFAPPEQLPVLRSLVTRLTRAGFAAPLRLIIAAGILHMPALAQAARRITDAVPPTQALPTVPLPRPLGTLRLGDGVDLMLVGLPVEDTFAPTWTLALPGAAAVVRLAGAGGQALKAHCEAVEVMLIEGDRLPDTGGWRGAGPPTVTTPAHLAALVRAALELAAGV